MAISLERGVFSGVLGLGGTGAIMMWPDQWWLGAFLLVAAGLLLIWGIRIREEHVWVPIATWFRRNVAWRFKVRQPAYSSPVDLADIQREYEAMRGRPPSSYPERHAIVVSQLAAPLATIQEQALTYGKPNLGRLANAKARVEGLIAEIPYDHDTVQTVRDFLQACSIVVDASARNEDTREARRDVARIAPGLFRAVHESVGVDRSKIDLPDWCGPGDPAAGTPNGGGVLQ
jgi:hypothetical protein